MTVAVEGEPLGLLGLLGLLADVEDLPALVPALEAWLRVYLRAGAVRVHVLSDDGSELTHFGPEAGKQLDLHASLAGRAAGRGVTLTGTDASGAAWTVVPVRDGAGAVVGVLEVRPDPAAEPRNDTSVAAAAEIVGPVLATARRWRVAAARLDAAKRFAERAILAQEAERARIAREIHDGVSQRLAGLGFHLSAAASLCSSADPRTRAAVREALAVARRLACLAGAETRAAISDLRPAVLDDLGLDAALASLSREASQALNGPEVAVSVTGESGHVLPDHVQTALYRIAQECLGNAIRHAHASTVDVHLAYGTTSVHLKVEDDGIGFMLDGGRAIAGRPDSFGLRSMRERAELLGGSLQLASRPGFGTTIRVSIPLSPLSPPTAP
jgi:two-component system NarL family sensor kinase